MNPYINTIIRKIKEGKVILFLGSGVNIECKNSSGDRAPVGVELAKKIRENFLPGEELPDNLQVVSACVETRESRRELHKYIYEYLSDFKPCDDVINKIPKFIWDKIYTTNFDTLLEQAYRTAPDKKQELRPLYSDRDSFDSITIGVEVPYYKIHGCITKITVDQSPLILTAEDYAKFQENRKRLFRRLQEDFFEHTFLFIGYSFLDEDFQKLFYEIQADIKDIRDFPRCYAVAPKTPAAVVAYWDSKKIIILDHKASEFFALLESADYTSPTLPESQSEQIKELRAKFAKNLDHVLAKELIKSFELVNENVGYEASDCSQFYRGDRPTWSTIRHAFDAERNYYEILMDDILLVDEEDKAENVEFAVITSEAGGGKTTLLMRLAYDYVCSFEGFCLYLHNFTDVSFPALEELYRHTKKRIYIFADDAADNIGQLCFIAKRAKALNIPMSIIAAERKNEWNVVKERLNPIIASEYDLPYLNEKEIKNILSTLEKTTICVI